MRVVTDNIGFLLGGLLITLELTAIGFVGALLLGTVLAVFRVSPNTTRISSDSNGMLRSTST